jgi:hypothetical protein
MQEQASLPGLGNHDYEVFGFSCRNIAKGETSTAGAGATNTAPGLRGKGSSDKDRSSST